MASQGHMRGPRGTGIGARRGRVALGLFCLAVGRTETAHRDAREVMLMGRPIGVVAVTCRGS